MRGVRFFNYPEFLGAKDALETFDFKVLMADLSEQPNETGETDTPLKQFMQHDLPLLCQADCVFVLPGWQNSHGAKVEVHLAFQLDIPVYDITTGRSIEEGPGDVLDDCPYEQKRPDEEPQKHHASGTVRSDDTGKPDYTLISWELVDRWAEHMTKFVKIKGHNNWRNANTEEDLLRAKQSFWRHARAWDRGDEGEDHAAAILFNVGVAELVRLVLFEETL